MDSHPCREEIADRISRKLCTQLCFVVREMQPLWEVSSVPCEHKQHNTAAFIGMDYPEKRGWEKLKV